MQEAEIPETFCCSWGHLCTSHFSGLCLPKFFPCVFKPEGDPDIISLLNLPDINDNLRWRIYSQVGFCCGATNAFLNRGAVASHLLRQIVTGTNNFLTLTYNFPPEELKTQWWRWKGWQGEPTSCSNCWICIEARVGGTLRTTEADYWQHCLRLGQSDMHDRLSSKVPQYQHHW